VKGLELKAGALLVALVVAAAALSLLWTPHDPTMPAGARLQSPSSEFLLGTDAFGRDVLSRLLAGAQSTVYVGIIAVGLAVLVGVPLGVWAAQLPPRASEVLLRATDVAQAFPALLLAILLAGLFGGSTETAMVAIGVASIPQFLRVARAGSLQVLASDFVLAARACGIGRLAIARTHVLPNIAPIVGVQATVSFALAILAEAVQAANETVYKLRTAQASEMGTTVSMALLRDNLAIIANVGDSRTYLWSAGGLKRLTTDHSVVETLVAAGRITRAQVYSHPQRNLIYRSLGDRSKVEVDTFTQALAPGDRLLLCSDGLWEMARDEGIEEVLLSEANPQRACDQLVEMANLAGGDDNITVIIVQVA